MQGKLRELLSLVGDAPETAEKRKAILDQYGTWLSEKHMREDAGVAFLAAGNLIAALEEYREGNHWRMALSVAGKKYKNGCGMLAKALGVHSYEYPKRQAHMLFILFASTGGSPWLFWPLTAQKVDRKNPWGVIHLQLPPWPSCRKSFFASTTW